MKRFHSQYCEKKLLKQFVVILLSWCVLLGWTPHFVIAEHETDEAEIFSEEAFQPRKKSSEPDFLSSDKAISNMGYYFGVGFRKLKFQIAEDQNISDGQHSSNGIGFDFGYYWEEQFVEYERQMSIMDSEQTLTYDDKQGQRLEVIQNNLWYARMPKINTDFSLLYGAGIQFTKTRFAATTPEQGYTDEIASGVVLGATYFATTHMMLMYRFSATQRVSFFHPANSVPFLKQSQIHSLYLNYYFPL